MSAFRCSKCGCVENTAVCNYWIDIYEKGKKPLCSECDPTIAKWHGAFPKRSASGMLLGNDGFLYTQEALDAGDLNWRMQYQGFKIINKIP